MRDLPADTVIDIGCGMGRALCLFARRNVRKCIGIEYDPGFAERAREKLGLTVLRALFQFSKRTAGEAAELGRRGVERLGMIAAARLERGCR